MSEFVSWLLHSDPILCSRLKKVAEGGLGACTPEAHMEGVDKVPDSWTGLGQH